MMNKLNMISYNNKKIVQETWLKFDNIEDSEDDTYFADLVKEDLEQNKIAFKRDEDNIEYVEIYDNGIGYLKPKEDINQNDNSETTSVKPTLDLHIYKNKKKEIIV